jgi:multidrug efflux system membrane fusion protein
MSGPKTSSTKSTRLFLVNVTLLPLGVSILLLSACSTRGLSAREHGSGRRGPPSGVPVTVAFAETRDVPQVIRLIGTVEAYSTISVTAQIGGQLTKVYFREGAFVKKNALLFTIDPRSYEATLQEALANLARDQGALAQAEATVARDKVNLRYQRAESGRYVGLLKGRVISKDQFEQLAATADASEQTVRADEAATRGARAQIQVDQAAVDQARVQLSYTTVRSPLDGQTSSLSVDEGNVLAANGPALMTIRQVSPIYVAFSVPEASLNEIRRYMETRPLQVAARTQGDPGVEDSGVLTFVDNAVDTSTGTIKVKATFANKSRTLWPGQFVNVTLQLAIRPQAVVAPEQAIQSAQSGTFVYVVRRNRTVEVRPVMTSQRLNQDVVIDRGLLAGEMVVTEGQLRLASGSRVAVQNVEGRIQKP